MRFVGRYAFVLVIAASACAPTATTSGAAPPEQPRPSEASSSAAVAPVAQGLGDASENQRSSRPNAASPTPAPLVLARTECKPADWAPRELPELLERGKGAPATRASQAGSARVPLERGCTDSPDATRELPAAPIVVEGVEVRVVSATPAGASGRQWQGNRCAFSLRLADGSGAAVELGPEQVPPFNTITAVVRSGSAAWLSIGFNGYTKEFPGGGNRVVAVDLCAGRVAWQSKDAISNGGLLLLDDYLIAPFGFTSERRFVHVLDARSGKLVQKLPVVENVCPSKSWAPNWHPGERCDAPGQVVGAATEPRVKDGLFYVDTNTGSSAFHFKAASR